MKTAAKSASHTHDTKEPKRDDRLTGSAARRRAWRWPGRRASTSAAHAAQRSAAASSGPSVAYPRRTAGTAILGHGKGRHVMNAGSAGPAALRQGPMPEWGETAALGAQREGTAKRSEETPDSNALPTGTAATQYDETDNRQGRGKQDIEVSRQEGAGLKQMAQERTLALPTWLPSKSGSSSSLSKPFASPRRRRNSAAAQPAAAIAPAELPPMHLKRYFFESPAISFGYTTPLVMPPS